MIAPSKTGEPAQKKRSPVRKTLRRLGSLKLAVVLLVVLAAVLAAATFLEAAKGRELALWYVYNHAWFIVLLAVLSVNVAAAMAVRFPWRLRHTGFLLAHFGLLAILAGAIQSFFFGMEGMVSIVERSMHRQTSVEEGTLATQMSIMDTSLVSVSWPDDKTEPPVDFPFRPGPVDWRRGRTQYLGELDGVAVTILKFYRYAQARTNAAGADPQAEEEVTFRSVTPSEPDSSPLDAAALIELTAFGDKYEFWLRRRDPEYGHKQILAGDQKLIITFGNAVRPLGFELELIDFKRGKNPGGMGNASFASTVRLIDKAAGIDEDREISMNQPLTHGKFTLYQSSFREFFDGQAMREASFLSAAYDPGRFLKYLGSLLICLGAAIMLCRRTRFFGTG